MHVSDCAVHEGMECDCGQLDLAAYPSHRLIPAFVPATGRFGFFVDHMGGDCFIEPEQLPPATLAAFASASHLPDAHNVVVILGSADGMNLNDAREAVVAKLKALALPKGFTGDTAVHHPPPVSAIAGRS